MRLVAVVVITGRFVAFLSIVVPNKPKATHLSFTCAATSAVIAIAFAYLQHFAQLHRWKFLLFTCAGILVTIFSEFFVFFFVVA